MIFRRRLPDEEWLGAIADLFINMSAGWFGAILIVPNFGGPEYPDNLKILTADAVLAIVSLVFAVRLKKIKKIINESR